jgi:redox-sensitive bicupin YhaK (pirin superfamily)
VRIHADARLYSGLFDGEESATIALDPARPVYVHLVRGELSVNGTKLVGGDAAKLRGEAKLTLDHGKDAEVLVFDLAEH